MRAAVVHVIPEEVAAATEHYQRQRFRASRRHNRTIQIRVLYPTLHLSVHDRVMISLAVWCCREVRMSILEAVQIAWTRIINPDRVSISTIDRQALLLQDWSPVGVPPGSEGDEWRVHTG